MNKIKKAEEIKHYVDVDPENIRKYALVVCPFCGKENDLSFMVSPRHFSFCEKSVCKHLASVNPSVTLAFFEKTEDTDEENVIEEKKSIGRKRLVILSFRDFTDRERQEKFLVRTDLNKKELEEKALEIIEKWEEESYHGWTYKDLIEELERNGFIEAIPCEEYLMLE